MRRAPGELFEGARGQSGSERGLRSLLVPLLSGVTGLALLGLSFFEVKVTVVCSHEDAGGWSKK